MPTAPKMLHFVIVCDNCIVTDCAVCTFYIRVDSCIAIEGVVRTF